jgi:Holliday junction resolvase
VSAHSRNKGAEFEREVAAVLHGLTGVTFKRDLEQYRAGEHGDLIADNAAFPFVIECKRYASGTTCKPAWRAQAQAAATATGKLPAVIYRFDRQGTRVSVPFAAIAAAMGGNDTPGEWAEITIEGLAYLAAEIMAGGDL